MIGASAGMAAAANYPAPFVVGNSADVAIVYGTGAGVSTLDLIQAGNIQTNLQSSIAGGTGGSTVVGGDAWQVKTSSDSLELEESIKDIETYIGSDDLGLLMDGTLSNEKGEAKYEQFLYFEDTTSSFVTYTEDDEDNIGLFFKVTGDKVIARYVMDFTSNLESDIETDGELSDIEDKTIQILGKTYTIVNADNGTAGAELTLMGGALGGTISNDEEITLGDYTISAVVSSATEAKFTINGETTDKMAKGDQEKLSDGNYLAVTDITYESYAGGLHQATFYIGADKIELFNGTTMKVNAETINEANVLIASSEASSDITITELSVNMTAEDDLYVPAGGKLSEADNLDEPEVLLSQNWDIEFKGLEDVDYEELSLKVSESDQQYTLNFENHDGNQIALPLVFTNASGVYGGEDHDERLILNPNASANGQAVRRKDYFILNTADPTDSTTDARSFVIQYKSSDKTSDTNPKVTFDILGVETGRELTLATDGTFNLKLGGSTFNFINTTTGLSDNFAIKLVGNDYATTAGVNDTATAYARTKYNALIKIQDTNYSTIADEADLVGPASANWAVNVTLDDADRDGDETGVLTNIFYVTLGNTSTDASASFTNTYGLSSWKTNPDNTDQSLYVTKYGVEIDRIDASDSPAEITIKIPESVVQPLLYISSGDVVISSGGGASQLGDVLVKDSEVSSVSSKNLIIVGGSCINSAAASVLGGAYCGAAFTQATGVGSGQFLIKGYDDASITSKLALVVAGYEAADTTNAATYLRTQTVDTSKEYLGTSSTSATLVTEEA